MLRQTSDYLENCHQGWKVCQPQRSPGWGEVISSSNWLVTTGLSILYNFASLFIVQKTKQETSIWTTWSQCLNGTLRASTCQAYFSFLKIHFTYSLKKNLISLCTWVYVYKCTTCMHDPTETRRGHWIYCILGGGETPCKGWELDLGPLREQQELLTTEPTLQALTWLCSILPPTLYSPLNSSLGQGKSLSQAITCCHSFESS